VPPALGSVDGFAAELAWGTSAGPGRSAALVVGAAPHPILGTLEVRVCDAQPDARDAIALTWIHRRSWMARRRAAARFGSGRRGRRSPRLPQIPA